MNTKLHIIMYHYVRDVKNSDFPNLKALDVGVFKDQLSYLREKYAVVTMEDVINSISGTRNLPEKAALLTFDDGYRDHYDYVFPLLKEYNMQGSFFPVVKGVRHKEVFDVNKIHLILSSHANTKDIMQDIFHLLDEHRSEYKLKSNEEYCKLFYKSDRLDDAGTVFIKRLLQKGLKTEVAKKITHALFQKYVSKDEQTIAKELYLGISDLKEMKHAGMHIGGHGFSHQWLSNLDPKEQELEVTETIKFLSSIGCDMSNWAMCYPWGAHNESLRTILQNNNCAIGLTTQPRVSDITTDDALALPRLDTIDLVREMTNKK